MNRTNFFDWPTILDAWDDMLSGKNAHKLVLRGDNFQDEPMCIEHGKSLLNRKPGPKNGPTGEVMDTEKLTPRKINALAAISTGLIFPALNNGKCAPADVRWLIEHGYAHCDDGAASIKITQKGREAWAKIMGVGNE